MKTLKRFWRGLARSLKILDDPSLRGETRELLEQMKADGVDPADAPPVPARTEPKTGRNDPCPCGGGKKYKKCCGA